MKISVLHIHWGFYPIIGGVETHLKMLMPTQVETGCKVGLLTCSAEGEKEYSVYKGVEIFRSPYMDLNWLYRRGLDGIDDEVRSLFVDVIDKFKPNIIHAHNLHYFSETHAKILDEVAHQRGIPVILTAHNVWDDILYITLTKRINWDHIIAVSYYIKKEIVGIGVSHKKVTVVHHGIDVNEFHPDRGIEEALKRYPFLKGRRNIVLHPCRVGLAKGADVSIKAINLVRRSIPDVLLVIGGTRNIIDWGAYQEKEIAYLVQLIKEFNLEENIYMDFFPHDIMPFLYNLADVCIYPSSFHEPFGLVMLEAMASAKPIIVTEMGGMPEIIHNGINGFRVPVKDFEALAYHIVELLLDEHLRERLGNSGREIVEVHYTKEVMTKCINDVYKKVLG